MYNLAAWGKKFVIYYVPNTKEHSEVSILSFHLCNISFSNLPAWYLRRIQSSMTMVELAWFAENTVIRTL